jgi:hypothetical protein
VFSPYKTKGSAGFGGMAGLFRQGRRRAGVICRSYLIKIEMKAYEHSKSV